MVIQAFAGSVAGERQGGVEALSLETGWRVFE